jgi:D-3-phosphoglycerate dehydrogenase
MKGLMTRRVTDEVNFINARVLAKEMGIKVKETSAAESKDYANLLTVHVLTTEMANSVSGTIFGKKDPRVIKINNFRLELIPQGYMALIYNIDRPGSIGEIGTTLGAHGINIGRMQVGQEEGGDHNIIFMQTDTKIDDATLSALNGLDSVKSIVPLEF